MARFFRALALVTILGRAIATHDDNNATQPPIINPLSHTTPAVQVESHTAQETVTRARGEPTTTPVSAEHNTNDPVHMLHESVKHDVADTESMTDGDAGETSETKPTLTMHKPDVAYAETATETNKAGAPTPIYQANPPYPQVQGASTNPTEVLDIAYGMQSDGKGAIDKGSLDEGGGVVSTMDGDGVDSGETTETEPTEAVGAIVTEPMPFVSRVDGEGASPTNEDSSFSEEEDAAAAELSASTPTSTPTSTPLELFPDSEFLYVPSNHSNNSKIACESAPSFRPATQAECKAAHGAIAWNAAKTQNMTLTTHNGFVVESRPCLPAGCLAFQTYGNKQIYNSGRINRVYNQLGVDTPDSLFEVSFNTANTTGECDGDDVAAVINTQHLCVEDSSSDDALSTVAIVAISVAGGLTVVAATAVGMGMVTAVPAAVPNGEQLTLL